MIFLAYLKYITEPTCCPGRFLLHRIVASSLCFVVLFSFVYLRKLVGCTHTKRKIIKRLTMLPGRAVCVIHRELSLEQYSAVSSVRSAIICKPLDYLCCLKIEENYTNSPETITPTHIEVRQLNILGYQYILPGLV